MTVSRIGIQVPSDRDEYEDDADLTEYEELSGMEYSIFEAKDPEVDDVLVATSHDAVGLVTWWRADSTEEAERWLYQEYGSARRGAAQESYDKLYAATMEDPDPRALNLALVRGLLALGSNGGDWDSESIEVLLEPIVTLLKSRGIPSVGSSDADDIDFWIGAAEASPL